MKVFEITFTSMIGHLTIMASNTEHAAEIFAAWHQPRYERPTPKFTITEATAVRIASKPHLDQALTLGNPGVASFMVGTGWVVLPADMEAAGPVYIEQRPVKAFTVTDDQNDCDQMFVFAADEDDADIIYTIWSKLHLGRVNTDFNLYETPMTSFKGGYEQFGVAAAYGATGVAGPCRDGYTILPPWDLAAGDL